MAANHHGGAQGTRAGTESDVKWSLATRIAFRLIFAYTLLFYATFSGFFAPFTLPIAWASQVVWATVIPWIAVHVLHTPPPPLVSDGDGLGQWIQVGTCGVVAVIVTLLWSIAARRRPNHAELHEWLRVGLRYALGVAMVFYGLAKVFHLQMLPPHLAKLVQPLGDSSPTSLLWIMMGSSAAYSAFTGFVETLGGALLFYRRTATLGALVSFGALVHVVVLNLSYDVSVKLWSANLLLSTLVLIVPEMPRLLDALVLDRPTEPAPHRPLFRSERLNRLGLRVGLVCLAITLAFRLLGFANGRGDSYRRTPTPLHGIHVVESFVVNGVESPPLLTDTRRWRIVVIERSGLASIRFMDDEILDYLTAVDSLGGTVAFVPNPDTTVTAAGATRLAYDPGIIAERFQRAVAGGAGPVFELTYSRTVDGGLTLSGPWGGDSLDVQLSRVDESQFLLLNRGFHWVQAYPYFR